MEFHVTYDMTKEECQEIQQQLFVIITSQERRRDWHKYIRESGRYEIHPKGGKFMRLTKPNSKERELRELWKMKRNEYYRSYEWAFTRNQCLIDADFVCSKCGQRTADQAHHQGETASLAYGHLGRGHVLILHPNVKGKNPKTLSERQITPICQPCHRKEHGIEEKPRSAPLTFSGMFARLQQWD